MNLQSNRIVIDWDEIGANGPYCGSEIEMDAWPPSTGLLAEVVEPFFRQRARYREILAAGVVRSLPRLTGWQKDLAWKITTTPWVKDALASEPSEFTEDRKDALAHHAGQLQARYGPEGLAMLRAARGAHPYQQCRKAHGCEHPCSCPKRTTTEEEGS